MPTKTDAQLVFDVVTDPTGITYAREILGQDLWSLPEEFRPKSVGNPNTGVLLPDGSTYAGQTDVLASAFINKETAVKSCHGSGKTRVAAVAVPGWLSLHPPGTSLVITTSASWGQVEGQLWGDIHKMLPESKWAYPKPNQFALTMPGGSRAFGMSTDEAVNFHGFHAENVLVIVDEVSGIKGDIMEAINSIKAAGNTHILYLMNPVEAAGPSVDLFEKPSIAKWTVDALLTPNMWGYHIYETPELNADDPDKEHNLLYVQSSPPEMCELDADPRVYLQRRRQILEYYTEGIRVYGSLKPEAAWFPRVRGLFPREQITQLIHRDWVTKCHSQVLRGMDSTTVVGIDVAGSGKAETALCARRGYQVIAQKSWGTADPLDEIISVIGDPSPTLWVRIDAVAIGYGLCNELMHKGYNVVFCNAKNNPVDQTRFVNAKAEWYWNLRELFQQGLIGGPIDKLCQDQLLTIRWDQQNIRGLVRIEPKEQALKRGVPSPDRAEAMMLCFSGGPMNIAIGQFVYDRDNLIKGAAGSVNISGPGWESRLQQPIGEVPRAMDKWLTTIGSAKAKQKYEKQNALKALLNPPKTALYDSNGKLIGYRDNDLPTSEVRRLEDLMEPAD